MAQQFTLDGDRAMIRALEALGSGPSVRRVLTPAVRAAMSPVNKAAKKNAKQLPKFGDVKRTGALAKSIGIDKTKKKTSEITFRVHARKGTKYAVPDPAIPGRLRIPFFYAHLVELGTRKMPARPFLGPAWESNRARAGSILITKTRENLPKEVARQRLKAGGKK